MMTSAFHKHLSDVFSQDLAGKTEDTLRLLGLRIPGDRDFFITYQKGTLTFVNDAGVVVRLIHDISKYPFQSPLMLPNLWVRPIVGGQKSLTLCIQPGVNLLRGEAHGTTYKMDVLCSESGIRFDDPGSANIGIIPSTGQHVVIDMESCTIQDEQLYQSSLARIDPQRHPALVYRELTQAFHAAWPHTHPQPDRTQLRHAWKMAIQKTDEGVMTPAWTMVDYGRRSVENSHTTDAASAYNQTSPLSKLTRTYA